MSNSVTPREAQRLVRRVVLAHNAACVTRIRTRITAAGLAVATEGRGVEWFACSTLGQVAAFADGVADCEIYGGEPVAREFDSAEERAAWAAGVKASAVDFGRRDDCICYHD